MPRKGRAFVDLVLYYRFFFQIASQLIYNFVSHLVRVERIRSLPISRVVINITIKIHLWLKCRYFRFLLFSCYISIKYRLWRENDGLSLIACYIIDIFSRTFLWNKNANFFALPIFCVGFHTFSIT